MKKIVALLLILATSFLAVSCAADQNPPPEENPSTVKKPTEAEKPTYSILFIGNSYTYYNGMPTAMFQKIAEEMGYQVEVTAITKGAYKLSQFADPTDKYGEKVEKALTGTKKYDYVVLQEQSVLPATEEASAFYDAVRNLSERIKKAGATPVLYATWGRKTGNSTLTTNGWTNENMTWKLAAAYQAIGDELGIPVAQVGLAFYDVYMNQNNLELYDPDRSHPSASGSYLAAVTLFAKIFDVDPTNVTYTGNLSSEAADILCEAARKAVFSPIQIPQEYQTTSYRSQ